MKLFNTSYDSQGFKQNVPTFRFCVLVAIIVVFILVLADSFYTVSIGEIGVALNKLNGKTSSQKTGYHFKIPFVESIWKYDVRTSLLKIRNTGASVDLQEVSFELGINYRPVYDKVDVLHKTIGPNYVNIILIPAVHECSKSIMARFPVEQIIARREEVRQLMEEKLKTVLSAHNLIVESVNIEDVDFSVEFVKKVEEKQLAEQNIIVQRNNKLAAEENAKQTKILADAEAYKNEKLRDSTSHTVVSLEWIRKWDGRLPQTVLGKDANVLLSIKDKD
ncbi:MAG: prohibitin family protein [Elusimicrobiota bacterium]|nr:prohibitin family protein [Elusimicrobiota bacterium]